MAKVKGTYEYCCSACGTTKQQEFEVDMPYSEPIRPSRPPGWIMVDRYIYCDKHEKRLLIDGEIEEIFYQGDYQ
jgi:hypothetical protein